APGTPISLSSATPEQLETLPGVGPVLAQHIVDYRTQHGGFTSVDQLKDVDGIGDKRFADIKPMVTP
ncbi:ComEA family DNA-binding protein, partial [Streptomyces albus]